MSDIRAYNDSSIAGIAGAVLQRRHGVCTLNIAVKNHLDQTVQLKIRHIPLAPHANLSLLSTSQLLSNGFEIALRTPAHLKTPCGNTLPLRIARGLFFLAARTGSAASNTPSQTRLCEAADGHAECTSVEPPQHGNITGIVATLRAAHDPHVSSHIAALATDAAATVMARRFHIGIKTTHAPGAAPPPSLRTHLRRSPRSGQTRRQAQRPQ